MIICRKTRQTVAPTRATRQGQRTRRRSEALCPNGPSATAAIKPGSVARLHSM